MDNILMNHYVYLIEKKNALSNQEKYYIGVRSCEGLIADDDYMGSSKYLTEEVNKLSKQSFNKIILKRFDNRLDANLYEIQMHEEFDVANNPIFFNRVKQKDGGLGVGPGELNPFYGKKHTEEYKQRLSALLKTKDCRSKTPNFGLVHTEETKLKMSLKRKEYYKTNSSPMLGVKRTPEMQINSSLSALNQQKHECVYCGVVTIAGNIKRWHNDNCKKKVV
jgi:hypothetical protein